MTNWKLTQQQKEEILRLYLDGLSPVRIARRFGVSHQNVCQLLIRRKLKPPPPLPNLNISEIAAWYAIGWTAGQIGKKFGIQGATVLDLLRRNGIPVMPPGPYRRHFR